MIPNGRPFVAPAPRPEPPYFRALVRLSPAVGRAVAGRFPGVCPGVVEEASQEVLLAAWLERPRWEAVWEEHGEGRLRARLQLAVWRQVRGWWRRHGRRSVGMREGTERPVTVRVEAGQEVLVRVHQDFGVALQRAVAVAGAANAEVVRAAVLDGLGSELSESALAERHGTRREYLNRARNALWREVWA